jgi:outer membrane receptor protein involved in Fe transport
MVMRLRHYVSFTIALICIPALLCAQSIRGNVINHATKRPVEFVNVMLLRAQDSALVTGTNTDRAGHFIIANVPEGSYVLQFSLVSYAGKRLPPFRVDRNAGILDVGAVPLVETVVELSDVLVTGQKALFNTAIDRKVYNVEQDVASKSGSVSELLANVPSIEVDIEGNVSLRGSSNVLIMINGKTSPLMGKNRADVLQQMPASAIERIEVITNPSAKYKPDGTSGIINLVLKKNVTLGVSGSLTGNAGLENRYNGSARLNYSSGTFNLFSNFSLRHDRRTRASSDERTNSFGTSEAVAYRQDASSLGYPESKMAAMGFEVAFDPLNSAGVSGEYFTNSSARVEQSNVTMHNSTGVLTSLFGMNVGNDESRNEYSISSFYERKLPGEDHSLRLEVQASREKESEVTQSVATYVTPAVPDEREVVRMVPEELKTQLTLDYKNKLADDQTVEAGYAGELNTYDIDAAAEIFDRQQGRFILNPTQTNHFRLDESIHALYTTYERSFGRFGMLAGLRGEFAFTRASLLSRDSVITNSYVSVYPTLHLSFALDELAELQLNYSRRTRRPEADELNPFPEYHDQRNIHAGNSRLLPEYINSVELGCKWQNDVVSVFPSIYYRHTYNRFTSVVQALNDSTLLTTEQNLSSDQSAGFECILSASAHELLSSTASFNLFYNQIDATNLGYGANRSVLTWTGALTCNLHVTRSTMAQINAHYQSARLTPQGNYEPSVAVNVGLRQRFWEDRFTVVFTMADVFKSVRRELHLDSPLLRQTVVNTRDARVAYLGITYHFGTPERKKDEDGLRYDNGI